MLNSEGERILILSIFEQALQDATDGAEWGNQEDARRFLDKENALFKHYCHLIDLLPDFAYEQLWNKINAYDATHKRKPPKKSGCCKCGH